MCPPGPSYASSGANGAGKTTLVRTITSLLFVHNGKMRDGRRELRRTRSAGDGDASAAVRSGICQVPEGRMLFPRLTVDENLRVGAATRRDGDQISKDVDGIFDTVPQPRRTALRQGRVCCPGASSRWSRWGGP
jgi:branched-chain amino acid transport system ATP-binding protein